MNAFEPLLWTATLWLALRMVAQNDPRYWLAIGAVWGVGMENKYSMLFPAAALVVALLLTPRAPPARKPLVRGERGPRGFAVSAQSRLAGTARLSVPGVRAPLAAGRQPDRPLAAGFHRRPVRHHESAAGPFVDRWPRVAAPGPRRAEVPLRRLDVPRHLFAAAHPQGKELLRGAGLPGAVRRRSRCPGERNIETMGLAEERLSCGVAAFRRGPWLRWCCRCYPSRR